MQVYRDEFPGFEQVWKYFPHLGRIFVMAFPSFSRVYLKPAVDFNKVYESSSIPLYVQGPDKSLAVFQAGKSGPYLDYHYAKIRLSDFKVGRNIETEHEENREAEGFADIARKFETWIRNQASAVIDRFTFKLDLYHWSEVCLVGHSEDTFLKARPYFIPEKWKFQDGEFKPDFETLGQLKFWIIAKGDGDPQHSGLFLPRTPDVLKNTWRGVVSPRSDFRKMMDELVEWYTEWLKLEKLYQRSDITIDFAKIWKRYQDALRQYESYLGEITGIIFTEITE